MSREIFLFILFCQICSQISKRGLRMIKTQIIKEDEKPVAVFLDYEEY